MSPTKTRVAASAEVAEGRVHRAEASGRKFLLTRVHGRVHGVVDRCPHMGMSLAKGKVEGSVITCPWHNSRFDLCSGRNLDWVSAVMGIPMPGWTHKAIAMGKSPAPLTVVNVAEEAGEVYLLE